MTRRCVVLCFSPRKGEEDEDDDEEEGGAVTQNGMACNTLGGVCNTAFSDNASLTQM